AEREKQLTQIRNQAELEYRLQREENTAAIAQAQLKNIESFGLETLAAIDPAYQAHIDSRQAQMDLERENTKKAIELARQKLSLIKEIKEIQEGSQKKPAATGEVFDLEENLYSEHTIQQLSDAGLAKRQSEEYYRIAEEQRQKNTLESSFYQTAGGYEETIISHEERYRREMDALLHR